MRAKNLTLPMPLDELQGLLRKYGVTKASIFGSYARGEATTDSDLDLLVELEPGRSYLDLGGLQYELEKHVPGGVDIATKLNKHFEPYIKGDLTAIF